MKSQNMLVCVHVTCEHEHVRVQGCMWESMSASTCVSMHVREYENVSEQASKCAWVVYACVHVGMQV